MNLPYEIIYCIVEYVVFGSFSGYRNCLLVSKLWNSIASQIMDKKIAHISSWDMFICFFNWLESASIDIRHLSVTCDPLPLSIQFDKARDFLIFEPTRFRLLSKWFSKERTESLYRDIDMVYNNRIFIQWKKFHRLLYTFLHRDSINSSFYISLPIGFYDSMSYHGSHLHLIKEFLRHYSVSSGSFVHFPFTWKDFESHFSQRSCKILLSYSTKIK